MKSARRTTLWTAMILALAALLVVASCAPAAAPTPTPTKAPPPAVAPTPTAPPKAVAPTPTPPPKVLEPLKIPVLTILTGPGAGFGAFVKIGAKLAEEDINKGGGINGHPIQFYLEDTALNPAQTVTVVRKVAERDKAFAFVGPLAVAETDVSIPLANELKIPMINYGLISAGSPPHLPWVFRIGPSDDMLAPILIKAFKKKYPQVKRLVIAGDTKEKATEAWIKQVFPKHLPPEGYEIIGTVEWESGTTDFGAIVTKLKGLNPDGLAFAVGSRGGSVEFATELTRQGVKIPVMGGPHFALGGFMQRAGANMEGWIISWAVDPNRPDLKDFNARLEPLAAAEPAIGKPYQPGLEYQVYDSIMMLAKALREAKITPDMDAVQARTLIADGYRKIKDYNGTLGKLSIDSNQAAVFTAAAMIVRGGFLRTE